MEKKYIIEKNERKELAKKIGELTGAEVKYLKVPTCAYQIGGFHLSKEAILTCDEQTDDETIEKVLNGLADAGYPAEDEPESMTVSMPREFFTDQTLDNLGQIIRNKHRLISHALGTDNLDIEVTEETVDFPWFSLEKDGDSDAYLHFISALCEFAKNRKRVLDKEDGSDNEKYAFRCFLLRLGMIGADHKNTRKVLLRNLTGSSAFRHGKPDTNEGGADDAVSE